MLSHDRAALEGILRACQNISGLISSHNRRYDTFLSNYPFQTGCCSALIEVGRLAGQLSKPAREGCPYLPWDVVEQVRDDYANYCDPRDLSAVWEVLCCDVPTLSTFCQARLAQEAPSPALPKKVEIIGAAIVDVLVSPADPRVFETGSSPAERIAMTTGGDALNEAAVVHHLGVPVHLETIVGQDLPGQLIRSRMEQLGLETSGLHCRSDLNTSVNVVLVQENGERSFLTDPHASQRQLTLEDIPLPFPEDVGIVCFASIFVFPKLKAPQLEVLFRQARQQGITLCADMTKCKNRETAEDMAPALQYVDYLFGNDAETMMLTRTDSVEQAAEALLRAGAGTVVIKCGAKGCYVRTPDTAFRAPAQDGVECVDTTGAGDSFVGGFLSGLARQLPLEDCVALANRCGACAVQHVGAVTWTSAAETF